MKLKLKEEYENGRCCALCGRNGSKDPLDTHHIFGGSRRDKSEYYGLTVKLCHHDCHIFGKKAAHANRETMQAIHEYGQRKVMLEQGWSKEEFVMEFGKNYLDEDELEEIAREQAWHASEASSFCIVG